jgi:hypothetical protein
MTKSTNHRNDGQRLASGKVFLSRLWRNSLWGLLVIGFALACGMAGYGYFGNMGVAESFANAAMILSGMGPLAQLDTTAGYYFEGIYALICGLVFFAVAGLVLSPLLHRLLHSFHIEDTNT